MKPAVCVLASVAFLAACNRSPSVELRNASANDVAAAVKQSGVMSGSMIEPGLWQSKVTVEEMNIPGMPAEYAGKMKEAMAKKNVQANSRCVTPEEVKEPKQMFARNNSCKFPHFTMGGGKMDMQMVCTEEGSTQTMNMTGTYSPTHYAMDMSSEGSGGADQGMTMKMHVEADRVGECTGKS